MSKNPNTYKQQERRQYHRATVKLPVVMMAGDRLLDGEIQDLSLGGAFIQCSEMPNPGDNFSMVITAEGRLISVIAGVVWTGTQKINNKNVLGGIGVQFKQILTGDRGFLRDVIASHYKKKISRMALKKLKSSQL